MADTDQWPQHRKNVPYSSASDLNTLDICLPRPASANSPKNLWLIYIHGGAWRDPAINSTSFNKTRDLILASTSVDHIAGMASINYRLSPYPSHPTDPSSPSDPARNAVHPDHVNDVLAAITYLQEQYHFGDRYVLIGHSCGATLAFQVVMKRHWRPQPDSSSAKQTEFTPPLALLGVEGIYDLPQLVHEYEHEPAYREFIANAFGSSEDVWKAASPSTAKYDESWPGGRRAVIMHSVDDELVSMQQPPLMCDALSKQGWTAFTGQGDRRLTSHRLVGLKHDEVWQDGEALAKGICETVDELLRRS